MTFRNDLTDAVEALFADAGDTATLYAARGEVAVIAIIRDDLPADLFGGLVRVDQTVIELRTAECGAVLAGEILTVGTDEYLIDRVDPADGLITRLACSLRSV